jgi:hypothetical protein
VGGGNGENSGKIHHHLWQNKTITQLNGSIYYTSFSLSGVHLHRVELNETYGEVSDKICLTLLLFKVVRRRVSLPPLFSTVLWDFALRMVQENQKTFQLKGTHQLLIHAEKAKFMG